MLDDQLDYVLADSLLAHHSSASHPQRTKLRVGDVPLVSRTLHFAVRRAHSDAEKIIAAFDKRVREMISNGAYNRVLGIDWIRADVDGDGNEDLILGGVEAGTEAPKEGYEVVRGNQPRVNVKGGYVVDGKLYRDWEHVPDTYKIEPTPVGAGVQLIEW